MGEKHPPHTPHPPDPDPCSALNCPKIGEQIEMCRLERCCWYWARASREDRARREEEDRREKEDRQHQAREVGSWSAT